MKTLREVMREGFIFSLQQNASVAEAAQMMETHNIGIVAVLQGERLVGVLSERDVVRRVLNHGRDPLRTAVGDVMTTNVIVATPDDDYQAAMRKMDYANIRHLPVLAGDRMISMLSIRDLMRVDMARLTEEVRYLHDYIHQVPH
ncbi:MAG: CBS domain-containing protein [Candidatus Binatia bacterium]